METQPQEQHQQPEKKKRNKTIVIVSVVIVGIVIYAFLNYFIFFRHQFHLPVPTQGIQSNTPLPQINVVSVTDAGFSPQDITVKKGTAVRWINNSSTDNASVNSDDYPTNRLYPELNLGKVKKGSTIVHIFTSPGTYTYHNQFNPKQVGTVNVE